MKTKPIHKLLVILFVAILPLSCQKESHNKTVIDPSKDTLSDDMNQEARRKFSNSVCSYELKEGVMLMSETQKLGLIGIEDNSTLLFDSSCTGHKMPSVGDVIICLDSSEKLPYGFQGKVVDISERSDGIIAVRTQMAEADEIFASLTVSTDIDLSKCDMLDSLGKPIPYNDVEISQDSICYDVDSSSVQTKAASFQLKAREYKVTFGYPGIKVSGAVVISGLLKMDVDLYRKFFYFGGEYFAGFKGRFDADLDVGVDFDETKKYIGTIPLLPLGPEPIFTINLNAYVYLTAKAEVGVSFEVSLGATNQMYIQHDSGGWSCSSSPGGAKNSNPFEDGLEINGKVSLGIGMREMLGINMFQYPIWNAKQVYVDIWTGLDGNYNFNLLQSSPIDAIKDTKYDLLAKAGLYIDIQSENPLGEEYLKFNYESSAKFVLNSFYIFPDFSDLHYEFGENNSVQLSCTQSRSLLLPVQTWFRVKDEDGNDVTGPCNKNYYWIQSLSERELTQVETDLRKNIFYYAYPVATYFGRIDIQSDDYLKFVLKELLKAVTGEATEVKSTSAVVTGSYEGCYDGCRCGIKYWSSSSSYTIFDDEESEGTRFTDKFRLIDLNPDTEYHYCAIIEHNTAVVAEGETKIFRTITGGSCLDNNHVHAIDLGLSVKWACCNVGASRPEEYGGYYAWGETEIKSEYLDNNYKYWTGGDYYDIGDDISGTQYDVAHVKWGGSWRMPTINEFAELFCYCDKKWMMENGVSGLMLTSIINGNSIFLPHAGGFYGCEKQSAGSCGMYWVSNISYDKNCVGSQRFEQNDVYTWLCSRCYGLPVRPVSDY